MGPWAGAAAGLGLTPSTLSPNEFRLMPALPAGFTVMTALGSLAAGQRHTRGAFVSSGRVSGAHEGPAFPEGSLWTRGPGRGFLRVLVTQGLCCRPPGLSGLSRRVGQGDCRAAGSLVSPSGVPFQPLRSRYFSHRNWAGAPAMCQTAEEPGSRAAWPLRRHPLHQPRAPAAEQAQLPHLCRPAHEHQPPWFNGNA